MPWDHVVASVLAPLAIWVLLNGVDDCVLDAACAYQWLCARLSKDAEAAFPDASELAGVPERRMAIFVASWHEHSVLQRMVERNMGSQEYSNFDFFLGVYPNDTRTIAAAKEAKRLFPDKVHIATCPHEGPTSKADCLNWIYQRMLLFEEENGARFEMVLTHDAEDLVHPEALRWINYYAQWHDMVQIPVLALPTPWHALTHGVYCDEFAEFQFKDMPARQFLGGFIPSNGVGTGFSRASLDRLAAAHENRVFEPSCLTEDYENGYRLHRLGCAQKFMPIHRHNGSVVATREYFPQKFRLAVKQRTRWVTGIALQSWEFHGVSDTLAQAYWFWRDRKSIIGNLVTPFTNVLFLYGTITWAWSLERHTSWGLAQAAHNPFLIHAMFLSMALQAFHVSVRAWCSGRIYGWKFACAVPLRVIWGNWINFFATASALYRYSNAKVRRQPLRWLKTTHSYPNRAALVEKRLKLGEILVGSQYVTAAQLEEAMRTKPAGALLGEHLLNLGMVTDEELYEALSLEQDIPYGKPERSIVSVPITRSFPVAVARKWQVLPFRVVAGELYVASSTSPHHTMCAELKTYSSLELRFQLVTPREFQELAIEYLP